MTSHVSLLIICKRFDMLLFLQHLLQQQKCECTVGLVGFHPRIVLSFCIFEFHYTFCVTMVPCMFKAIRVLKDFDDQKPVALFKLLHTSSINLVLPGQCQKKPKKALKNLFMDEATTKPQPLTHPHVFKNYHPVTCR